MLDGGQHGDDDPVHSSAGLALRVGDQSIPAGLPHHHRLHRDDDQLHFLGQDLGQVWKEAGFDSLRNLPLLLWIPLHILPFLPMDSLSQVSNNIINPSIPFSRFMVGFNIGCVPQSVTLYAEFLPTKQRGKCVVLLDCFWALGACLEVILAMLVMPTLGWRWLLALSALPSLAFVLSCSWLPESPRFMAASGNSEQALSTLTRVAKENGKSMLLGRLTVDDMQGAGGSRGRLADLLSKDLRRTTIMLWIIWLAASFSYYGVVLMSTELFESSGQLCSLDGSVEESCSAQCHPLATSDYNHLLWTTLAEFPGIMVSLLLIEKIGRKKTLAIEFFLFTITLALLFNCSSSRTLVTVILFMARALGSGLFQVLYSLIYGWSSLQISKDQ